MTYNGGKDPKPWEDPNNWKHGIVWCGITGIASYNIVWYSIVSDGMQPQSLGSTTPTV